MENICLILLKKKKQTTKMFSNVVAPFYTPATNKESMNFPVSLPRFGMIGLLHLITYGRHV